MDAILFAEGKTELMNGLFIKGQLISKANFKFSFEPKMTQKI